MEQPAWSALLRAARVERRHTTTSELSAPKIRPGNVAVLLFASTITGEDDDDDDYDDDTDGALLPSMMVVVAVLLLLLKEEEEERCLSRHSAT